MDGKVLVTGGAGYIGSHAVLALLDAGHQVVVVDNLVTGFAWAVDARATLVEMDVADPRIADLFGPGEQHGLLVPVGCVPSCPRGGLKPHERSLAGLCGPGKPQLNR